MGTTKQETLDLRATSRCTAKELAAVAREVRTRWQVFVLCLSSGLFSINKIRTIEDGNRSDLFVQTRTALDQWSTEFNDKAVRRSVIETLCKIQLRSQANAVFGRDLVDHVCPS